MCAKHHFITKENSINYLNTQGACTVRQGQLGAEKNVNFNIKNLLIIKASSGSDYTRLRR